MVNEGLTDRRCVPVDVLQEATRERIYEGKVSVTGLDKDVRFHWLKEHRDYSVNPRIGAAKYIGTAAHYFREKRPAPGDQNEVQLDHELFYGTSDTLSIDEWTGEYVLSDMKTRSRFSVKKMMEGHLEAETRQLNYYRIAWEETRGYQNRTH